MSFHENISDGKVSYNKIGIKCRYSKCSTFLKMKNIPKQSLNKKKDVKASVKATFRVATEGRGQAFKILTIF